MSPRVTSPYLLNPSRDGHSMLGRLCQGLTPPFSEEIFPNSQPEPLQAQLEAVSSHPVLCCLGETSDSPSSSLLWGTAGSYSTRRQVPDQEWEPLQYPVCHSGASSGHSLGTPHLGQCRYHTPRSKVAQEVIPEVISRTGSDVGLGNYSPKQPQHL